MKFSCFILFIWFSISAVYSSNDSLITIAKRVNHSPIIDGILDDEVWKHAVTITNFTQYDPFIGGKATFQTEVYVLYSDEAIYIGAKMYDTNPELILKQLGDRDDELNADHITFQFDPFNNNQDAYYFRVTASNVQSDWRRRDASFNAVWQSRTAILDDGWSVEIKIPFSALRIPNIDNHEWAFQVTRNLRRTRELTKWAPEKKGVDNEMIFWGKIIGIQGIKPPIRLSLTPYFSTYAELRSKQTHANDRFYFTPNGGLDLKYGINNSFTLDLTLLPDFSQVRSDDVIKNLSAFEVDFSEQRPFFLESMDLFKLGNIFYSRRIGRTPTNYSSAKNNLNEGEELIFNPGTVNLINSFKITGQTSKGLAVGFLNAITDKAEAEIKQVDGNIRYVETEALANYNVSVFRQALKNNSWVYLINTNLLRQGENMSANTTAAGAKIYNKSNKYALTLNSATSSRFIDNSDISIPNTGYLWNASIAKVRGNFQTYLYHQIKNKNYNINDMGLNHTNDEAFSEYNVSYRVFNPFWKLLRLNTSAGIKYAKKITVDMPTAKSIYFSLSATTNKHLSLWSNFSYTFDNVYDFYEPRTSSYFYLQPKSIGGTINFSSDYRRPLAFDGFVSYSQRNEINNKYFSTKINPLIRINDHLVVNFFTKLEKNNNSIGFAGRTTEFSPVFGQRDVQVIENAFAGKYIFRNNLSLSLRVRHYWSKGEYERFYLLNNDGTLNLANENFDINDFNFNHFNVDMIFNWEFAPGSNLTFVWKNSISDESARIIKSYLDNLNTTFAQPELNMFSLKFLYYLDYHVVKTRIKGL